MIGGKKVAGEVIARNIRQTAQLQDRARINCLYINANDWAIAYYQCNEQPLIL